MICEFFFGKKKEGELDRSSAFSWER